MTFTFRSLSFYSLILRQNIPRYSVLNNHFVQRSGLMTLTSIQYTIDIGTTSNSPIVHLFTQLLNVKSIPRYCNLK
jgi:hypothetical protein